MPRIQFAKRKLAWQGQAGMTVIEIVIAMSIAGITMAGAGKGLLMVIQMNQSLGVLMELNERFSVLQRFLMSEDTCKKTNFMGLPVLSTGNFPSKVADLTSIDTQSGGASSQFLKVGENKGGLLVNSIEVIQMSPAQGQAPRVALIELRIRGQVATGTSRGAAFEELIPMLAHVDVNSATVSGCGRDFARDSNEDYICKGLGGAWSSQDGGTCVL